MVTLPVKRVPSVSLPTHTNKPSVLARTLLLAVLFSCLPSTTASPLPSVPAPGPGFDSGEPLAPASEPEAKAFTGLSIEYSDLEVLDSTKGLHMEDDDWDAEYEDLIGEDERIGFDVVGNGVETGAEGSPESVLPFPSVSFIYSPFIPSLYPFTLPSSSLSSA